MARINGTRHVMPFEAFISFLVQTGFRLNFGGRKITFFSDDLHSLGEIHTVTRVQRRGAVG